MPGKARPYNASGLRPFIFQHEYLKDQKKN